MRRPGDRKAPVPVSRPDPSVTPSEKPPVRIYPGFGACPVPGGAGVCSSVRKTTAPLGRYEIYLMKDLEGFDRSMWKTGFTNYRYAIPALAGNQGRAIYNDVDQIYLADPAELFDAPMGEAAVLSINDKETSVMLLDCEKLAPLWRLEETQRLQKHKHYRGLVHDAGLWGHMAGV